MTDWTRLVSERLNDAEAAEAVRRLDKGGTGIRPDRQGIAATVLRLEDGANGMAVFVKDSREVEAARKLLDDEGWPVYWPRVRAGTTTHGDPCRNCLATKDPADVCKAHRGKAPKRPVRWWPESEREVLSWWHRGETRPIRSGDVVKVTRKHAENASTILAVGQEGVAKDPSPSGEAWWVEVMGGGGAWVPVPCMEVVR